jgi:hypothetical protein
MTSPEEMASLSREELLALVAQLQRQVQGAASAGGPVGY